MNAAVRRPTWLRRVLLTVAVVFAAVITPVFSATPAHAATSGCYGTIPGFWCWTGSLYPTSSGQMLISVYAVPTSCYFSYRIADTSNGNQPYAGSAWTTFVGYASGLNTGHRYQLGVKAWGCTLTAILSGG